MAPRKLEELKASTAKAEERYKAAQKKVSMAARLMGHFLV
jgi:hypothetical protein